MKKCECGHSAKTHEVNSWITTSVEHADCRLCSCAKYQPHVKENEQ